MRKMGLLRARPSEHIEDAFRRLYEKAMDTGQPQSMTFNGDVIIYVPFSERAIAVGMEFKKRRR